jgi:DNA-binding XRE family transcriptional regulator
MRLWGTTTPHLALESERPLPAAYPDKVTTIGRHIRKRRLDLGLLQKNVAQIIDVSVYTTTSRELHRTEPRMQYMPGIIRFLGYDPTSVG